MAECSESASIKSTVEEAGTEQVHSLGIDLTAFKTGAENSGSGLTLSVQAHNNRQVNEHCTDATFLLLSHCSLFASKRSTI